MNSVATVVIIDYGRGNLFSVKQACEKVGLSAIITNDRHQVERANGIILPGVGAFGDAMDALNSLDLVSVIQDKIEAQTPFMGICLGFQLLFTESYEFGRNKGLNVVDGIVTRFENQNSDNSILKVPHVQWNTIEPPHKDCQWTDTAFRAILPGSYFYFVHSFYVKPVDEALILSTTSYGDQTFCSSIQRATLFGCQFHPERSGEAGIAVYRNFGRTVEFFLKKA